MPNWEGNNLLGRLLPSQFSRWDKLYSPIVQTGRVWFLSAGGHKDRHQKRTGTVFLYLKTFSRPRNNLRNTMLQIAFTCGAIILCLAGFRKTLGEEQLTVSYHVVTKIHRN